MSDLYNRIEALCKAREISITDMCRESGASRGALSDLKTGRKESLSAKTLAKIAAYFDVTVDFLLGIEERPENEIRLDEIEFALYGEIRDLSDEDKKELLRNARRMRELQQLRNQQNKG